MTTVAALGDAHLGRSYYAYTADGVNQRERDFEESFTAAVDLALAQEPHVVVWLGDIFDHPRPTYRSFVVAQRALQRIRDHGVPLVAITGNHDTPRLPGTGSPYTALANAFPEFHWAHRLQYERFELPDLGLVVHAVPQMLTADATLEALEEADRSRSADRANLLLTHPRIPQLQPRYADINEIEVDAGLLRSDLVLLGHYHFHVEVGSGIWYAGSTDTFSFADDPEKPKGVVVLDTDSGACRHVPLAGRRPLVTLEGVRATGLSPTEVQARLMERVADAPEGAVARVYVDDVDPEAWHLVDHEEVRQAGAATLHLQVEARFTDSTTFVELPELESMPARWERYVADQDLTGYDRDRVKDLGHDYLARAVEAEA